MILFVDAYNILKQVAAQLFVGELERDRFIRLFARYAAQKRIEVVLIFDGGPYDRAIRSFEHGLTVIYSGSRQSADDVIRDVLIKESRHCALVSSDRQLVEYAHRLGAVTFDAQEFYAFVKRTLAESPLVVRVKSAGIAKKMHEQDSPEIDALMEEASRHVVIKSEDVMPQDIHDVRGKKRSKLEKKVQKVVKKL